ncbi:hypothetical protein V2J56_03265 [Georgenia sp. MJ206]|uniref:hypothetical protein n=1 Tax=Georgenia wangjunii TaxID=3117730 RepID=UPI002F268D97
MPRMGRDLVGCWTAEAFRGEATDWVRSVLGPQGRALRGTLVPHRVRFWAAVLVGETDEGRVWFKATNTGQGFEVPLLARLGALVPDHVVRPLAVEPARGWLLLPDGGPTLRERGEVTVADWEGLVAQAARMQVALVPHEDELAEAGLPGLPPQDAYAYAVDLVAELASRPVGDPQHVPADEARLLRRGLERIRSRLSDLAASGVPLSLQPNDVSLSNTVRGRGAERFRFFDLGDGVWSHPFAALQVPVRLATGAWSSPPAAGSPTADRLVRAYAEQWPQVRPGADLDRLVDTADRLASLHRCESWRRLLAHVDPDRLGTPTPRLADWLADAARG